MASSTKHGSHRHIFSQCQSFLPTRFKHPPYHEFDGNAPTTTTSLHAVQKWTSDVFFWGGLLKVKNGLKHDIYFVFMYRRRLNGLLACYIWMT